MSSADMMTVGQMIDAAFCYSHKKKNVVNFNLLETILVILAKQSRILDRKVKVDSKSITSLIPSSDESNIVVSEVKLKTVESATKELTVCAATTPESTGFKPKKLAHIKTGEIVLVASAPGRKVEKIPSKLDLSSESIQNVLGTFEEKSERVLRVIDQRSSSREEGVKEPTPMASIHSADTKGLYEKIFVVNRVSDSKPTATANEDVLSLVTKQQFGELSDRVKRIEEKYQEVQSIAPEFPENMELMQELRKGASLTDAMSALQLSARLEATEKAVQRMSSLLSDIAQKKENVASMGEQNAWVGTGIIPIPEGLELDLSSQKILYITQKYLTTELEAERERYYEFINKLMENHKEKIDDFLEKAEELEPKVDKVYEIIQSFQALEDSVSSLFERITTIDTALSSQMTNIQEQLTQMQFEVEAALESVAELIANKGVDPDKVLELHMFFSRLKDDFENANNNQKQMRVILSEFEVELSNVKKEIEQVLDVKADRDEVQDALRNKANLQDLNGMVEWEYFEAVVGDLQERISRTMHNSNLQENRWQKIVEDLGARIEKRADDKDFNLLSDDIQKHLNKLYMRLHAYEEICGEPRSAVVKRAIIRDTACIACNTPAQIVPDAEAALPVLPALKKISKGELHDTTKPQDHGDHSLCIPGQRAPVFKELCTRYCGGAHTVVRREVPLTTRLRDTLRLQHLKKLSTGEFETEVEKPSVHHHRKPCIPCNRPVPAPPEAPIVPVHIPKDACLCDDHVLGLLCRCGWKWDSDISLFEPTDSY